MLNELYASAFIPKERQQKGAMNHAGVDVKETGEGYEHKSAIYATSKHKNVLFLFGAVINSSAYQFR